MRREITKIIESKAKTITEMPPKVKVLIDVANAVNNMAKEIVNHTNLPDDAMFAEGLAIVNESKELTNEIDN